MIDTKAIVLIRILYAHKKKLNLLRRTQMQSKTQTERKRMKKKISIVIHVIFTFE